MKNDLTVKNISDLGANRYPHLKYTLEEYPRILATRRIEDDDAEYYGAFLTKTAVRIMLDLIDRVFRLRTCDIEIDGNFPVPCTQFYRRRCAAPCVRRLCSKEQYLQLAELAKLFIANRRDEFREAVLEIIAERSEELDFEKAAYFRDMLGAINKFWENPRFNVWLDDTVDTYAVEDTPDGCSIFLITHRGRAVLGRKVFTVPREESESSDEALSQIIDSFYVTHLPKEIRVTRNFYGRAELSQRLSERFGRAVPIVVKGAAQTGVNARRGLHLGRDEHELDKAKPIATPDIIASKLARIFGLTDNVHRVEAYDVAHISGTGFVAAWSVWDRGRFLSADYRFEISSENSELAALSQAVLQRLREEPMPTPDLIVLDGGKPQLNAVLRALEDFPDTPAVAAAVKPRGKHSAIAAFLTPGGGSIEFNPESPAHSMLQLLRDEAHDLANRVHRDYREMMPFYEIAGAAAPLVVPLRFHAENGGAEDLIPIETR